MLNRGPELGHRSSDVKFTNIFGGVDNLPGHAETLKGHQM